jgi:nucleoid-associated protein YgaU
VSTVPRGDTYVVQPNDNFSTISEKLYGTSSYFKALQEHNKAKFPHADRLRTGDIVATPAVDVLRQNYPKLCPLQNHLPLPGRSSSFASQRGGRVYVVEEGDTLFDIARFELGKATRWAEIYELNKDVIGEDFNHLRPGTQLTLPAEMQDDTFTRRPSVSVPR